MIQDNSGQIALFLLFCAVGIVFWIFANEEVKRFLCWCIIIGFVLFVACAIANPSIMTQGINP